MISEKIKTVQGIDGARRADEINDWHILSKGVAFYR
jgi:hypothetical protein